MKIPKREGACGRERRIPICRRVSRPILLLGLGAALSYGQFTNVTNNTSTPIAGAGHDYRQFLSETVSPANGSLSVRIQVPVPKNRGVTVPFSFDYDSNGVNNLAIVSGTGYWEPGSGYLIQGGWSYGIPLMTAAVLNWPSLQKGVNCPGQYDYVFTNSAGERHAFAGLTLFINAPGSCPSSSTLGGDDDYTAQISNGNVLVADRDGTVFTFEGFNHNSGNPYTSIQTALPTTIEDRNGNVVSVADPGNGQFTFTDSAGRPVLSSSGFATASTTAATYSLTVSGLAPYQVTWGTAASNFDLSSTTVTGNACGGLNSYHGSQPVVTAITLPNGQQYQFQYESTYGLLSKVIYPNGAYSRYSWAPNSLSDAAIWPGMANQQYYCTYLYSTPAVQNRYVSFDGVNEVLEEDYSYATTWSGANWSSKSSTVTTTVRDVQNGSPLNLSASFTTDYTYSSTPAAENFYDAQLLAANIAYQIPIEQSVVYNDFGGAPLKTDTKTWLDQFLISSETVALNDGSTSENIYSYYPNGQLETEMEYDYGANAPGALLRKTVFNYQGFPAAPIFPTYSAILDRPCQVVTFDESGTNRVAETDYYYDGGTTLCGTAGTPSVSAVTSLTGHDETNYANTSIAPRGNVTQESRQNIQLSTAATSTYAYDETGQVKSATDPRGNTRGYSYADSYASGFGTPPGQTNAYLTQLTLPNTGSPAVNHVEKFTYRYDDGQLASSSDQNSAPNYTDYIYADPLGRLTETDYPDSGKTTVTYNDTASPPTVVTKRLLGGSTYLTSTTVLDGAGHAIQSQLNSDPSGTDNTNTVYDGLGRVFSVSNPYRSTNDSTYGITLYTYDGLGRTTNVTTPDGAIVSTSYSGPKTTVTDQAGRQRTMTADALGRIKQVVEDPGSPVCSLTVPQPCHFNYSTTYTYDALDDLTGVNQSNSLTRTFTYDSLKRLTQAINPESGTINYTYDLNGNLFTKADAHPKTITYGYDALNRITGKQYSDKTPAVSYTYDLGVNGIGLLTSVANGSSTTNYLSFDAMGRVLASNQVTGSQTYPFSYTYNLAGSVMTETYPSCRTITTGYDGANRPDAVTGVMSGAQTNYVAGVSYAPAGGPTLYQYGNNLWRQISYNNRLQMSGFIDLVNNSTGSELLNVGLTWGTTNNNGNLQSAAYKNGGPGYAGLFDVQRDVQL